MANTFKVINFAAEPASSGTPYVMYTAASSTTTVVLGLILANIDSTQRTATVRLVSDKQIEQSLITLQTEQVLLLKTHQSQQAVH